MDGDGVCPDCTNLFVNPETTYHTIDLEYSSIKEETNDGIFSELPEKLAPTLQFDHITLQGPPASKRITLWFRSGAKRVYHIRLIRKTGRCLVQIGGLEPATVLKTISICRDHFDNWFGISAQDIQNKERPPAS